jgi:hypothetical protein
MVKQKINTQHKKHAGGRPPLKIDYELVKRLASINCTVVEIACALDCSESYLLHSYKFMQVYKKEIEDAKSSLRRLQWAKAEGREGVLLTDEHANVCFDDKGKAMWKILPIIPDTTMQIWLGKQYLGQRDKQELTGANGGAVQLQWVEDGNKTGV